MIADVVERIRNELTVTFNKVYDWFGCTNDLLNYVPCSGGWSIAEVLEHISITNHFLLLLIRKAVTKSLKRAERISYAEMVVNYDLAWDTLKIIGEHKSFEWNRPAHMEPVNKPIHEVKTTLMAQAEDCLNLLDQVSNGEGVLYKTMMSVNDLGKIDVYHYLYFLVQHAKRHIRQMELIKFEFEK